MTSPQPYQQPPAVETGPCRSSGVYALVRLDGGPIEPRDAAALDLGGSDQPGRSILCAVDTFEPAACSRWDQGGVVTVVAGFIEQAALRAHELGLESGVCAARIARAALARHGAETPRILIGEWSLVQWDESGPEHSLTIMGSAARRDPLFFACSGPNVAVAPDLFALSRIGWVGSELDPSGLLMMLGRAQLRAQLIEHTMLRAVSRLEPGEGKVFTVGQEPRSLRCPILSLPPRWTGRPEDALAEAEELLLTIMRERLERTSQSALLLSGGLDSSLLAWASAAACESNPAPIAFTTATAPGSTASDEMPHAGMVAAHLGMPHQGITPDPALDSYRPSSLVLSGANGPTMSNRHCLTAAFQQVAHRSGVALMFNGTYGEGSMTARLPQPSLHAALRRMVKRLLRRGDDSDWPVPAVEAFHVRLSPALLDRLPGDLAAMINQPAVQAFPEDNAGLLGFGPVAPKALAHPNEFHAGAVRMDFPFRDLRLLRLFAALPIEIARALGPDRGPARTILQGRLPDAIVNRQRGLPADPDHHTRLQQQAPQALTRLAVFRQQGLDAWLDLDWLETELRIVAASGVRNVAHANLVQLTAMTAEFLLWWQDGARVPSSRH